MKSLSNKFKLLSTQLASSLIDASFLVLWLALLWIANWFLSSPLMPTDVFDRWMLEIFRIIFAISTLVAVSSEIIKDTVIIILRTIANIRGEMSDVSDEP